MSGTGTTLAVLGYALWLAAIAVMIVWTGTADVACRAIGYPLWPLEACP